jgi:hypothetical protein
MNATLLKTLFLAWQDYQSRLWFPVGRLTFDGEVYTFVYIKGANSLLPTQYAKVDGG